MYWFRIPAKFVLLLALVSSAAGQDCVIADEAAAEQCVDVFKSYLSLDDICSLIGAARDQLENCENMYIGDCYMDQTYDQLTTWKTAFETLEAQCQDTICYEDPAIDACYAPFRNDDVCAITKEEEDQVSACVRPLAAQCTADTETVLLTDLAASVKELSDRKDEAVCNDDGQDARNAIEKCSAMLNANEEFISLEDLCRVSKTVLDCYKTELDAEPDLGDSMASHIAAHLDIIRGFGCELAAEWADATLLQAAGCSIMGGLSCYKDTDVEELLEYVWEDAAITSYVVQSQTEICQAVGKSNLGSVTTCLETQLKSCPRASGEGLDFSIDFLNVEHSRQLTQFCGSECENAAARQQRARQCLADVEKTLRLKDCPALRTLVSCVMQEVGSCPLFMSAWRAYTQQGLAEVASHCKTTIGIADCYDRQRLEEEVRADCMETGTSFGSKAELCSAYDSHLRCMETRTAGCASLTNSLIEPSRPHYATINQHHDCDIQYRGQEIAITESGQCALAHYGACFAQMTTAFGEPALQSANLSTVNAFTAVSQLLMEDPTKCSASQSVDTDAIEQCVEGIIEACQYSAPSGIRDPWLFDMVLIDQRIDDACDNGCRGVDLNVARAECGKTDDLCRSLDIDATFNTPKGDQCEELRSQWNCVKGRIEKCPHARDAMNDAFASTCSLASRGCFGEVLKVTSPPSTTPKPDTAATTALPQVGILLAAFFICLFG